MLNKVKNRSKECPKMQNRVNEPWWSWVSFGTWRVSFGTFRVLNGALMRRLAYAMVGRLLMLFRRMFCVFMFFERYFLHLWPCKRISASRLAKHNNHKQKSSMARNQNFSHSTIYDIYGWFYSFDFSTKTIFTAYKLEGIKALRNVKIKWDFLHVVVKFWDPEDHVF